MTPYAVAVNRFFDWLIANETGPRFLRAGTLINAVKLACGPVALFLMAWWSCWTLTARLYALLHGSYGLLWVAKARLHVCVL